MHYVAAVGHSSRPAADRNAVARCQQMFADFSRTGSGSDLLYARLAAGVAGNRDLAGLLVQAPEHQRLPVLLFACVHRLLFDAPDDPLGRYYPTVGPNGAALTEQRPSADGLLAAFATFCRVHAAPLGDLLRTRRVQTNEIGRCALFLPPMARVADEAGPLAQVDVGASAGLNLLMAHYDVHYEPGGLLKARRPVGPAVVLRCGTRGDVPLPPSPPPIAAAVGLDSSPIDVDDRDEARWLEACMWPDQPERLARLQAAIAVARITGVDVRAGDAVDAVASLIDEAGAAGHPVVTTSWVLNYLSPRERRSFVTALDGRGDRRDLSWVYAESPALCPELPGAPRPSEDPQPTAVVLVRWRGGRRSAEHLADAHPHGAWIHWRE